MDEIATTFNKLIDVYNARFVELEKHLLVCYQHINVQQTVMLEYKNAIVELQRQVKELQGNAADKILLEEPSADNSLGLDDGYRANTNDR